MFSPGGTLISASAAPHCGAEIKEGPTDNTGFTAKARIRGIPIPVTGERQTNRSRSCVAFVILLRYLQLRFEHSDVVVKSCLTPRHHSLQRGTKGKHGGGGVGGGMGAQSKVRKVDGDSETIRHATSLQSK